MATGLQFTFTVEHLMASTFVVTAFKGEDALSAPFDITIQLASRIGGIIPNDVVDKQGVLTVWQDGETLQAWHGIIRRFAQSDTGHHHTFYEVSFVPPIARLALRQNSRIFQHQSVPDIISIVLQEMEVLDYAFSLTRQYLQRDYCVQYGESDLAFVQRIAAEEGIFFHFSHSGGKNTVIFADDGQNLAKHDFTIPYNALAGGASKAPHVGHLVHHTCIQPNTATLQDRTFKNPAYRFIHSEYSQPTYQRMIYEHYEYGAFHGIEAHSESFTKTRLELLRRDAEVVVASSNVPSLLAGLKFELSDHNDPVFNRDWLLVSVEHEGTQPQALEEMGGEGITRYHNTLIALQGDKSWRPELLPKPRVDGVSVATVVGPDGEEIYCDEFGRVKVFFPWDRYSESNDKASCWVRVSQAWAGGQYGSMMLPRIGQEVLISYLEGDIDRPIITGRTYNTVQQPPYALPENKTRTVLRSETHQGSGHNELSFEDQAGKEEVYIHAQKDMNVLVNHDQTENIKHDYHQDVGNERFTHVKVNDHLTVEGESRQHTKGNHTLAVDGSVHMKQGQALSVDAGREVHIKAGDKIVLEAGAELTLKAGGSFIKIDASGVSAVGSAINLNSGGSAGTGSGYQGVMPALPKMIGQAAVVEETQGVKVEPIKEAAEAELKEQENQDDLSSLFNFSR